MSLRKGKVHEVEVTLLSIVYGVNNPGFIFIFQG